MSTRRPFHMRDDRPAHIQQGFTLLQCTGCNQEFWSTDRFDLWCLTCKPERPARQRPTFEPARPLTHREFVKAGADRQARDKQPHAPWRSPGEREFYD